MASNGIEAPAASNTQASSNSRLRARSARMMMQAGTSQIGQALGPSHWLAAIANPPTIAQTAACFADQRRGQGNGIIAGLASLAGEQSTMHDVTPFWEAAETVARFAGRAADIHWQALLDSQTWPPGTPVLDLGCAAGRNTPAACAAGLRPVLLDYSRAMLHAAGGAGAPRVRGSMTALPFADASFELVLCLGVYHCATSDADFEAALAETARVLRPGGRLLASLFSREMLPAEAAPVAGQRYCHRVGDELLCRPDAAQLDAALRAAGLVPEAPVTTRLGPPDSGRVTLLTTCRRAAT